MILIVDSRGHLLCPQMIDMGQCRGGLRTEDKKRYKILSCEKCDWELNVIGFMVWDVCLAIDPRR